MIATVETERDVILTSAASTHLNAGKIKMLAKLKAIGPGFATILVGDATDRRATAMDGHAMYLTRPIDLGMLSCFVSMALMDDKPIRRRTAAVRMAS